MILTTYDISQALSLITSSDLSFKHITSMLVKDKKSDETRVFHNVFNFLSETADADSHHHSKEHWN